MWRVVASHDTFQRGWSRELDDLVRGMSGGFLFGIPLLYTMEVWWIGSFVDHPRMLVALAASFVVVLLLNHTGGFRRTEDIRLRDAAIDSVEALAIGVVCTSIVLVLLRRITFDTPLDEALGKVIYEAVPFTLGVALARQLLSSGGDTNSGARGVSGLAEEDGGARQGDGQPHAELNATVADVGATLVGALFVAFNIAPTDEIPMLAAASEGPWLLAMIAASLLISYAIVFEAGFADQEQRMQQRGVFQRPLSETVASYLISLVAAAIMLWFFESLSLDDPWQMWLRHTLVLGLPATIGGAAGRLAV